MFPGDFKTSAILWERNNLGDSWLPIINELGRLWVVSGIAKTWTICTYLLWKGWLREREKNAHPEI
jgi:hypothetical protein